MLHVSLVVKKTIKINFRPSLSIAQSNLINERCSLQDILVNLSSLYALMIPGNCIWDSDKSSCEWHSLSVHRKKVSSQKIFKLSLIPKTKHKETVFVLSIVSWSYNCLLRIIISYLKPCNSVKIICIRWEYLI